MLLGQEMQMGHDHALVFMSNLPEMQAPRIAQLIMPVNGANMDGITMR